MSSTDKRMEIEGDPYSKFAQAMRKYGRSSSSTMVHGTITAAPPEILLRIDNDDTEYDRHDIYVAEHLTSHTRIANIYSADIDADVAVTSNGEEAAPTVIIEDMQQQDATILYTNELQVGDRVLVECDDANMRYTIIDRLVSYA